MLLPARVIASALLVALAIPAQADVPPGWAVAGTAPASYRFNTDRATVAPGSSASASIEAIGDTSKGFGTLMQMIAADIYRGARVKLSAQLRTEAAGRGQMWMRVDGSDGRVLAFDNMNSRPLTGSTDWHSSEIVLDVPHDAKRIAFGFLLSDKGKIWADAFQLEKVSTRVALTAPDEKLPVTPRNLDFAEPADSPSTIPNSGTR